MGMVKKIIVTMLIFCSCESFAVDNWTPTWGEFVSPVTTDAKYILFGGIGLALALQQWAPEFIENTQAYWSEEKPLKESSQYGDLLGQGIPNAIYAGAMYWHYSSTNELKSLSRSMTMLKASLYSAVVAHSLKMMARKPRPNNPDSLDSFPSGHTTAIFSFASVIGVEHNIYYGTGAYLLATFSAVSRMNDNRHRIDDLVAGAAIGMSYGLSLYYQKNQPTKSSQNLFQILPTDDLSGIAVVWLSNSQ